MKKKNIIVGLTGSVAAYKTCDLISLLRKKGHNVICIMTKESREFITPLLLESLSENKVYTEMFDLPKERDILHVSLAKKADLIVVCPATANILGKIASGICDDLLTCTVISSRSPALLAPAMNENMYKNAFVQKNIQELKRVGYIFVGPVRGHLACGTEGMGHIADHVQIASAIERILKKL